MFVLRIAICDDNDYDRTMIQNALIDIQINLNTDFDTTYFTCGEELCDDIKYNSYDVILLDILMDGIDGIETASIIRNLGEDSKLIFISSYDERIRELFDIDTIAFLDKPLDKVKLKNALNRCYEKTKTKNNENFSYKKSGRLYFLPINDIIYFQSIKNNIKVKTKTNEFIFTDSLIKIWAVINAYSNFIMPSRSFIVNLNYSLLENDCAIIENKYQKEKLEIKIGRSFNKDSKSRYMKYLNGRI